MATDSSHEQAETIERLRHIGWRGDELPAVAKLARVVAQHRAGYEVHDGERQFGAQPDGHFLKRGLDPAERPAVGDFVEVAMGSPPHIMAVSPRRSVLSRAAAGERYERQLIATNIDYVLVLTGLDGDFNPARIERYLSLIEDSGAQPVVLLSKVDIREDADEQIAALRERLPEGTPIHAINGKDPAAVSLLTAVPAAGRQRGAGRLVRRRQVDADQYPAGQPPRWPRPRCAATTVAADTPPPTAPCCRCPAAVA